MKRVIFLFVVCINLVFISCKKDATEIIIPEYLTNKLWILDTITINAPLTFDALTEQQKFEYTTAMMLTKNKAEITFRNDGSVLCGGDWDLSYTQWQLQNNEQDLKMTKASVGYDTLKNWQATNVAFSYTHKLGTASFNCTYIYK